MTHLVSFCGGGSKVPLNVAFISFGVRVIVFSISHRGENKLGIDNFLQHSYHRQTWTLSCVPSGNSSRNTSTGTTQASGTCLALHAAIG